MENNRIHITIIIPTFNRAATIGKTIESFISQTYMDWDMIVVDDYSKDNTKEIIEDYHKCDGRINYHLNERKKGAQGARNTGILHAQADWVVLFDSDDIVYPNFLEKMIPYCIDGNDVVNCYAQKVNVIDGTMEELEWGGEGDLELDLLKSIKYVNFDNCIIRKSKLFEIGLLAEDCPAYQEYDTHIRLSRVANYKWVKEVLMDYMWGGADTMSAQSKKNLIGLTYVLLNNHKRWKEVEPDTFKYHWMTIFRRLDIKSKCKLISVAPNYIVYIPYIYWKAFYAWLGRKMHKS